MNSLFKIIIKFKWYLAAIIVLSFILSVLIMNQCDKESFQTKKNPFANLKKGILKNSSVKSLKPILKKPTTATTLVKTEPEKVKPKPKIEKKVKIQVGVLPGSTPEVAELMKKLNQTGNQLVADAAYDNVERSLL